MLGFSVGIEWRKPAFTIWTVNAVLDAWRLIVAAPLNAMYCAIVVCHAPRPAIDRRPNTLCVTADMNHLNKASIV
jgi:hypothetical protein